MFLREAYSILLRLYPADFRDEFGVEMVAVFEQAAADRREHSAAGIFLFVAREMLGLMAGAVRERVFHRGASRTCEPLQFPSDIAGAEKYVEVVSRRLINAIANHDFPGARYYDEQDRKARALLAELRAHPN